MTGQTVTVGNATIVLSSIDDPLSEGHATGYLEFYDERHLPLFPLTSQAIQDHPKALLTEPSCPELLGAGPVAGWMEALIENTPQTFRSVLPEEHMIALQICEQKKWANNSPVSQ